MGKKLQIKLMPNGEIQMETLGIKGKKCMDYVEVLKRMINVKVLDTQMSEEYYETDISLTDKNTNNTL